MYALTALIASLSLAAPSLARLGGFTAPSTVTAGQNLSVTLQFEGYIQNYNDFGVVVGLARQEYDCASCAGTLLDYIDLSANASTTNHISNVTYQVPIAAYTAAGDYTLKVGEFYLVGASGSTGVKFWNSTLTVQNGTSS